MPLFILMNDPRSTADIDDIILSAISKFDLSSPLSGNLLHDGILRDDCSKCEMADSCHLAQTSLYPFEKMTTGHSAIMAKVVYSMDELHRTKPSCAGEVALMFDGLEKLVGAYQSCIDPETGKLYWETLVTDKSDEIKPTDVTIEVFLTQNIMDILQHRDYAYTAEDLYQKLRSMHPQVKGISTVRIIRSLDILCKEGLVHRFGATGGLNYYIILK